MLPLLASCGGGNHCDKTEDAADTVASSRMFRHARFITHTRHNGYDVLKIKNPWDSAATLSTYILIPEQSEIPDDIPQGVVVRVPLRRALVYSSVHTSLLTELGMTSAIAGVCDVKYQHDTLLLSRVASGSIADCGSATMPDIEKIMVLSPDAVLLSPYENSGTHGKLGQMGIPLIECADYMETTPLGRAEWIKLYGLLFGCVSRAEEMFSTIESEYMSLKRSVANVEYRPKVLVDKIYNGTWSVPADRSTMSCFINDAGGENPFSDLAESGSAFLSGEQVLYRAADADIWLVRYFQNGEDLTKSRLAAEDPLYSRFDAFRKGEIYGCNSSDVLFYEEIPFHPQWLLRNLISLLHPEVGDDACGDVPPVHSYFKKME